jgi:hypothetical protein
VVRPSRPDKNKQRDQGEEAVQRELHKNFSRPRLLPPDALLLLPAHNVTDRESQ